jgi:hypothetical protein
MYAYSPVTVVRMEEHDRDGDLASHLDLHSPLNPELGSAMTRMQQAAHASGSWQPSAAVRPLLPLVGLMAVAVMLLLLVASQRLGLGSLSGQAAAVSHSSSLSSPLPLIARTVHLHLVAQQNELDAYLASYPHVYGDAVFYCWRAACTLPTAMDGDVVEASNASWSGREFPFYVRDYNASFLVSAWSSGNTGRQVRMRNGAVRTIDPHSSLLSVAGASHDGVDENEYWRVSGRVWLLNEAELGARTTWVTGRNLLIDFAQFVQEQQGWRYAYTTLLDGDVRIRCPELVAQVTGIASALSNSSSAYVKQMRRAVAEMNSSQAQYAISGEQLCYIGYAAFLLTAGPAVAALHDPGDNAWAAEAEAAVGWHADAMLASMHSDAIAVLLPYCPLWDNSQWWASQVYLIYRTICMFGHVLFFHPVIPDIRAQSHAPYPRGGDPFLAVNVRLPELLSGPEPLYPPELDPLRAQLGRVRYVGAAVLNSYGGWSADMLPTQCTSAPMNLTTCMRSRNISRTDR